MVKDLKANGIALVLSCYLPWGSEEKHENLGKDSRCPCQNSNLSPPEYKPTVMPLRQPAR
jgi:hypothetical protein